MHSIIVTSAIICTLHHPWARVSAQLQEVAPPQLANKGVQTLQSLQSLQRSERRIQNMDESSFFLPGLGVIKEFVPQQVRPARSKSSASSHPRISPQRFRGEDSAPRPLSISPVSVRVSDSGPPSAPARQVTGDKCEYVQMKGDERRLEDTCMRGGMSCERKCDYDTSEPVCEQELTVSMEDNKLPILYVLRKWQFNNIR